MKRFVIPALFVVHANSEIEAETMAGAMQLGANQVARKMAGSQDFCFLDEELPNRGFGGKCGICLKEFPNSKSIHVDHDHNIKQVRGLLCPKCNMGIGYFDDAPELLLRAVEYLKNK